MSETSFTGLTYIAHTMPALHIVDRHGLCILQLSH